MANERDDHRSDNLGPASGGLDNKLLMAVAAGALFGSVGTYAYLSGNYRFVEPDKYDQLVRGAPLVADNIAARPSPPPSQPEPQQPRPRGDERSDSRDSGDSSSGRGAPSSGQLIGEEEKFDLAGSPSKGAAGAKVTLVEFSDFQCPACPHWGPALEDMLKTRGSKVRLVYKFVSLPDHKDARGAALAGQAANLQGKFWELAAVMFKNQDALQRADLLKYAAQVGLDVARFEKDMDSEAVRAVVDRDQKEGERSIARSKNAGIPAFFLNGRRADAASPDQLEALIDGALK